MLRDLNTLKKDTRFTEHLRGFDFTFYTTWGLFSPEHIDDGTRLLIEEIEVKEDAVSLDLGCGYGAIGLVLAKLSPKGIVHMVDKDFVAVEYAEKNAKTNNLTNCKSYLSNGFSAVPANTLFDIIVSNLPAKPSKELYWILFEDAKKNLKPGGKFYVVIISGLKEFIKRSFDETFGNYKKLRQGKAHAVLMATKE